MSFLSLPNLCQIWTDCIIEELPPSFLAGWWYSLAGTIFAMAMATIPLDWAWRDFCLCKISCLVRLYVCQSDLQWPTEEYPGSARTCPSQGFSFMRKYWFNLSWVCGQLVTQTVRPQDLLEIQPQIHCYSILFKYSSKNNSDGGCPEGQVTTHSPGCSKSLLDSPGHPQSGSY